MKKTKAGRIVISAFGSGSGKTTVSLALLAALKEKKISVQSFKCGPDYIDPLLHSRIIEKPVFHCDLFFQDEEQLKESFARHCEDKDLALIEGAMGFYDGINGSEKNSCFEIAKTLSCPVILVCDPRGMGATLAALLRGICDFKKDSNVCGVIFTKIRPALYEYYKKIVRENSSLEVCGFIPENTDIVIKNRHLGLVTDRVEEKKLADLGRRYLDLEKILKLSKKALPLYYSSKASLPESRLKIAVARDEAFNFYYEENLDCLRAAGGEIVYFSPLHDRTLPENTAGIYIGGGYPELYAGKLSENTSMLKALREAKKNNIPIFAECGGFMYLHESFETENKSYEMAGLIKGSCHMTERLVRFGYIELRAKKDGPLLKKGEKIKAHEFHYSDSDNCGSCLEAVRPNGRVWNSYISENNLFAGYPHLFFPSFPEFAGRFISLCREVRK